MLEIEIKYELILIKDTKVIQSGAMRDFLFGLWLFNIT